MKQAKNLALSRHGVAPLLASLLAIAACSGGGGSETKESGDVTSTLDQSLEASHRGEYGPIHHDDRDHDFHFDSCRAKIKPQLIATHIDASVDPFTTLSIDRELDTSVSTANVFTERGVE